MKYFISFSLRGVALAVAFVLNIVLANNFTKTELGHYFIFVQLVGFLSVIIRYGSDNSLLKMSQYFNVKYKAEALKVTAKKAVLLSGVIVFIASIYLYISGYDNYTFVYLLLFCVFPFSFTQFSSEYLKGIGKQNLGMFIQSAIIPSTTLLLFYLVGGSLEFIYTLSCVICVSLAVIAYRIRPPAYPFFGDVIHKYKSELNIFFIITLMNMLLATMDSFMIGILSSASEVAEYNIANKLVLVSSIILVVVNSFIGPVFSKLWNDNNVALIKRKFIVITSIMALFGIFIFAFFLLFGNQLLVTLYGESYQSSYYLLIILAFAQAVVLSSGPVAYLLMMTNNTQYHKQSLNITIFINAILNCALIPLYGAIGAAIATSASLIFKNVYSLFCANKAFNFVDFRK